MQARTIQMKDEFKKISRVLETTEQIDKRFCIPEQEFIERQKKTYNAITEKGVDVGIVFSDQHYNGDVPYLGGNTTLLLNRLPVSSERQVFI